MVLPKSVDDHNVVLACQGQDPLGQSAAVPEASGHRAEGYCIEGLIP
jgi:hypothetical protein